MSTIPKIAVSWSGARIDCDGTVAGHDAGATLVRRLLRVFPGAVLVGRDARDEGGLRVVPLEEIDASRTVVVTMDTVDAVGLWHRLRPRTATPLIMNFVWGSTSELTHPVERAGFALSCALFPTFANSERTANEIHELVDEQVVAPVASRRRVAWVNLGIRFEHARPRHEPDVPVVLYPAIYLSDRKRPRLFLDVVERVHQRTPLRVEARLHERHLVSDAAMAMTARRDWVWVGPLTSRRADYWDALSHTTAFLATAVEESYGLEYVEALVAGAVGVLPDTPWARALLPEGYPFLYRTPVEAEDMLYRAVTDTKACLAELDLVAGGSFAAWLREHHSDDAFDRAITSQVRTWFGA